MAKYKPKSRSWLDSLSALTAEREKNPSLKYPGLAKALNTSTGMIANFSALNDLFDPPAREKVRQAAEVIPSFDLSLNSALALTGLEGKVKDLPSAFHETLDEVLVRHYKTSHIKALVEWVVAGKPAKDFDPKVKPKTQEDLTPGPESEDEGLDETPDQGSQGMPKARKPRGKGRAAQAAGKGVKALLKEGAKFVHEYVKAASKTTANYFVPLHSRSSRKRGGTSSLPDPFRFAGHWGLYWFIILFTYGSAFSFVGHFVPFVGHWIDAGWVYLIHLLVQSLMWLLAQAFAKPWVVIALGAALVWGIHKEFRTGLVATLIVAAVLGAGWFFRDWIMDHLTPLINQFSPPSHQDTKNDQVFDKSKIQSPITTKNQAHPHSQNKFSVPKHEAAQVSATQPAPEMVMPKEDKASLETEIAALPRPCRVKAYSLEPDANMGAEMAGRRFMDIQDPEKYSFWLGPDEKKITSAVVNGSQFTLEIQGGFSFGDINPVLGDSSKKGMAFYWEDVRAIHCCEVDVLGDHPRTFYQFSMQFADFKKPFAVQCNSEDDLVHLVSGAEFWVRNAQGGKNAPIGALPCLYQGLLIGSEGEVTGTWDDSPIAKAGLKPGDHIWSVDSNPGTRMGNEELLSKLQSLPPGQHALYVVDPGEWVKGMAGPRNRTWVFNPKRAKLELAVP